MISPGSDREAEVKVRLVVCLLRRVLPSQSPLFVTSCLETQITINPRGFHVAAIEVMPRLNQRTSRSSSLSMSRHEA